MPVQQKCISRSPPQKKKKHQVEIDDMADEGARKQQKRRREASRIESKLDDLIGRFSMQESWLGWELKWPEANTRLEGANRKWEEVDKRLEEEKTQRVKEREGMMIEFKKMQDKMKAMELKIDELENRSRRANLVVRGVQGKDKTWANSDEKVLQVLESK